MYLDQYVQTVDGKPSIVSRNINRRKNIICFKNLLSSFKVRLPVSEKLKICFCKGPVYSYAKKSEGYNSFYLLILMEAKSRIENFGIDPLCGY